MAYWNIPLISYIMATWNALIMELDPDANSSFNLKAIKQLAHTVYTQTTEYVTLNYVYQIKPA